MVPVVLKGFWQVWPPHHLLPTLKRRELFVQFLEPIDLETVTDDESATTLAMDRIYEIVNDCEAGPEFVAEPNPAVL